MHYAPLLHHEALTDLLCKKTFQFDKMEADHIIPWAKVGKTVLENCQMLCMLDNRTKAGI
jgi:5-methylcytosine-specific restriction endonuclease McrA